MSNLFQRQLSQVDQHNLHSPPISAKSLQSVMVQQINPQSYSTLQAFPRMASPNLTPQQTNIPAQLDSRNYGISTQLSSIVDIKPNQQIGEKFSIQRPEKAIQSQSSFFYNPQSIRSNQSNQENQNPTQLFTQEFQNMNSVKKNQSFLKHSNSSNIDFSTYSQFEFSNLNSPKQIDQVMNNSMIGKKNPLDRPLKNLLENAISKAINQSDRVATPTKMMMESSLSNHSDVKANQNSFKNIIELENSHKMFAPTSSQKITTELTPRKYFPSNDLHNRTTLVERQSQFNSQSRSPVNRRDKIKSNQKSTPVKVIRSNTSSNSYLHQYQKKGSPLMRNETTVLLTEIDENENEQLKKIQNSHNHCQSVSDRVKSCMTPHKRIQSSTSSQSRLNSFTPKRIPTSHNEATITTPRSPNYSSLYSVGQKPFGITYEQQLGSFISNSDVQGFLRRHFLVGEINQQLICDNWETIPLVYFIKLIIMEFPEVLEDHQIGESVIAELKEKVSRLVQNEQNITYVDLTKLQKYTKTTGLLGLILQALKDLSLEESQEEIQQSNSNFINQMQYQASQKILQNTSHHQQQSFPTSMHIIDNFKNTIQSSFEQNNQISMMPSDIQNIKNIIQEFVESLYGEMENEIYSKFNIEMRRLTCKYKETQQLLQQVNDTVNDNFGIFKKEQEQQKIIKTMEKDNKTLVSELQQKQMELIQMHSSMQTQTEINNRLMIENQRLQDLSEKYLQFNMQHIQAFQVNSISDKYEQRLDAQTTFFQNQINQLQAEKKAIQENIKTEHSEAAESCNLSQAVLTLEDLAETRHQPQSLNSASCIPTQAIQALHNVPHQEKSVFHKSKSEFQNLEPIGIKESPFADQSDKISLFHVLNVFILQAQEKEFISNKTRPLLLGGEQRRIGAADRMPLNLSLEQASEKLSKMIEILPLIREVRLFTFPIISNFLQHMYSLQSYIYASRLSSDTSNLKLASTIQVNEIPMNKCWKKILAEKNNKDFYNSSSNLNQFSTKSTGIFAENGQLVHSTNIVPLQLTPKRKPDIFALKKINHSNFQGNLSSISTATNSNGIHIREEKVPQNEQIVNNQGVIDIIIHVLRDHLEKIKKFEESQAADLLNEISKDEVLRLKVLILLNIMLIANSKNDVALTLQRLFEEIKLNCQYNFLIEFLINNQVIDIIMLSLNKINFASSSIISETLQFLTTFKQTSPSYMAFTKQISSEKNLNTLIKITQAQIDSKNIIMSLTLLKNVSFSLNSKDIIKTNLNKLLVSLSNRAIKNNEDQEISNLIKAIQSNLQSDTAGFPLASLHTNS